MLFKKKTMDNLVGVFMVMSIANIGVQWYQLYKRNKSRCKCRQNNME